MMAAPAPGGARSAAYVFGYVRPRTLPGVRGLGRGARSTADGRTGRWEGNRAGSRAILVFGTVVVAVRNCGNGRVGTWS